MQHRIDHGMVVGGALDDTGLKVGAVRREQGRGAGPGAANKLRLRETDGRASGSAAAPDADPALDQLAVRLGGCPGAAM